MNELIDKMKQYLCPPGNGVFTVHTAKENKESIHNKLYQTADLDIVHQKWSQSLDDLAENKQTCLLGVTLDTGGGIQRGANWGPLFIRNELITLDEKYFDLGDVRTIPHLLHDKYLNNETIAKCQNALYSEKTQLPVSCLSITEDFCENFYKEFPQKKIFALGGDHSVSYSLVKPWLKAKRSQGIKAAVIHFDAHTDLMAHRLGIDICFASWAYHMLELLDDPSHMVQFGIRSSGQNKSFWESELGVKQYWAQEIIAPNNILDEVITKLKNDGIQEVYISFDIDALDSEYASSTGTPEKGGLAPHHCVHIIDSIAKEFKVTGADLVEVAPFVRSTHFSGLNPEPATTLQSSRIIGGKLLEVMN